MNCAFPAAGDRRFRTALLVLTLVFAAFPTPGAALTAGDVLDNMNDDQRGAYLAGNIDMAAQLSYHDGKRERSDCIFDWYYKQNGVEQIVQALDHFRDRPVQPVIYALINRACGE